MLYHYFSHLLPAGEDQITVIIDLDNPKSHDVPVFNKACPSISCETINARSPSLSFVFNDGLPTLIPMTPASYRRQRRKKQNYRLNHNHPCCPGHVVTNTTLFADQNLLLPSFYRLSRSNTIDQNNNSNCRGKPDHNSHCRYQGHSASSRTDPMGNSRQPQHKKLSKLIISSPPVVFALSRIDDNSPLRNCNKASKRRFIPRNETRHQSDVKPTLPVRQSSLGMLSSLPSNLSVIENGYNNTTSKTLPSDLALLLLTDRKKHEVWSLS
jgi:hypothetical protein